MNTSKGNSSVDEGEINAGQQDVNSSSPSTKTDTRPPVPLLPDDIDDCDDNFPLITSVFSLASGEENDEVESPEAKKHVKKESSKEVTSQEVGIKSAPYTSPQENGKISANSLRVNTNPTTVLPTQGNAPYYVGKGKLILPRTEESKSRKSAQTPGMTFSKMVSIHPISTSDTNVTTKSNNGNEPQTSKILTRNAVKKSESDQASHVTGSSAPASVASTSGKQAPVMVNLSNTLPFLNVKLATTQIAVPPMNTPASSPSTSVLSSSSPLVQLIKRITPPTTTVTQSPGTTLVKSTVAASAVSSPKAMFTIPNLKLQKPRHVNIAPAPVATTARLVMVPQTVTSPLATNQVASTTQIGNSVPRVVMVPKQTNSSPVTVPKGQIMYLIENKTADGKTYRFLIPDNAKLINNKTTSPQTVATATLSATGVTSTQLIKIIPKPIQTSVVTQVPKVATAAPSPMAVTTVIGHAGSLSNAMSPTVAGNITPPGSTSPTVNMLTLTSPEQDSMNTPPISPAPPEESPSSADASLDTGLSPHEARIQKLKELLRKQEEAVERLREKRKKEIDDIRSSPAVTSKTDTNTGTNKRDSPFAVPLPPKKSRLDQNKRKLTETSTQTSKDGFLPNSDDQQFVKLVGLEKVVDKIKAKKMLELQGSKVSN